MKPFAATRSLVLAAACSFTLLLSCAQSNGQSSQAPLAPKAFQQKAQQLPDEVILDVRTPAEYATGHIDGALNRDWNAGNFEEAVADMDKQKPLLVYCKGGGRSSEAVAALRKAGFKNVYELEGGMMAWQQAGLPQASSTADATVQVETASATEMSRAQYDSLVASDKAVLVDFYAEWCGPCKKMKPSLDELAQEFSGKMRIERIDVDKNPELGNELKVVGLPTLLYYKKGKLVWQQMGYMSKEQLKAKLQ